MNKVTESVERRGLFGRLSASVIACGLIISLPALPASADELDPSQHAENIAEQVTNAAPDNATPVPGTKSGDAFDLFSAQVEATVPIEGSDAIEVQTSVRGEALLAQISLPSGLELGEGVLASDGTVVYGSATDESVAVQTLPGGETRIQTVIPDADGQHEFGYGMDGFRATIDLDGNAAFVADTAEGAYIPIEPAWAVDANGDAVETYYEVRGDELFQVVVPSANTAYPVVADPTWGWRNAAWGVTLSRTETSRIKDYAAAASFCAALVKNQRLTLACGVWSGYLQVQAATANNRSPRGCLHVVAVPLPGAITHTHC